MKLRKHQREIEAIADNWQANGHADLSLIAHVVPGGGKSWLPKLIMDHMPRDARLMWCVPRRLLVEQAVRDVPNLRDIEDGGQLRDPCRSVRGFVLSHNMLSENISIINHELRSKRYFVVVDEMHHAGVHPTDDTKSKQLAKALWHIKPAWVMYMTGTLERNDNCFVFGLDYANHNGVWTPAPESACDHYVRYTRQEARGEGAIVPIEFFHLDGTVKYRSDGSVSEAVLSDEDDDATVSRKLFVGLETHYAKQLLHGCLNHFQQHGRKMLVVCHSQEAAKEHHRTMPIQSWLAITENTEAQDHVRAFKEHKGKAALVTCAMAYEGLDCKDITHICSLTHIRSTPWIYQMLGRAWRAADGKTKCWCYCPDDKLMNAIIEDIRKDELPELKFGNGGGPGPNRERSDVLPLEGIAEAIRRSMLDGEIEEQEAVSRLYEVVDSLGISRDHPAVVALIETILSHMVQPAGDETITQKEKRLRKSIAKYCRKLDYDRQATPGTHQKKLFEKSNWRSIKDMSIQELEHAWDKVQTI